MLPFFKKIMVIVLIINKLTNYYVRLTGLEPALREQPDPKSGASTNSATSARKALKGGAKIVIISEKGKRTDGKLSSDGGISIASLRG